MMLLEDHFWPHVDCDSDDQCWEWKLSKHRGYGYFHFPRKQMMAHRVAYILAIGPIPQDCDIHHKCKNKGCVNPYHLTALTRIKHNQISERNPTTINTNKTHCKYGHEYTQTNTYITKNGWRSCRLCHNNKSKQDRINLILKNTCSNCRQNPLYTKTRCKQCIEKQRIQDMKRYWKRRRRNEGYN